MNRPLTTVKVEIRCRRCSTAVKLCVPISRPAPDPLRCTPGGSAGIGGPGGHIVCSHCQCRWFASADDLRRAVEEEVRSGWGRHLRSRGVVLTCG